MKKIGQLFTQAASAIKSAPQEVAKFAGRTVKNIAPNIGKAMLAPFKALDKAMEEGAVKVGLLKDQKTIEHHLTINSELSVVIGTLCNNNDAIRGLATTNHKQYTKLCDALEQSFQKIHNNPSPDNCQTAAQKAFEKAGLFDNLNETDISKAIDDIKNHMFKALNPKSQNKPSPS